MNNALSMIKSLAIAMAMFSFATGAWAEHDDGAAHEGEEATSEEVIDEGSPGEELYDGGEAGEEILYMTGGGEEVVDGEAYPEEAYDSEGNVILPNYRADVEFDGEMIPLMAQSGAAGGGIELADTTANQVGIDGASGMELEVVGGGEFSPISVNTVGAAGGAAGSGTATRISGGHFSGQ